jgi:hypothetical protein
MDLMDFYILTFPRTGSHMLASALDSHPDINCVGEVWRDKPLYDWLGSGGKVNGGIIQPSQARSLPESTKMICLTRNPQDIAISYLSKKKTLHAMGPSLLPATELPSCDLVGEQESRQLFLRESAKRYPHIVVDYNEITNGQDIREIPESIGRHICKFLNVEYHIMTPKFYKPQRVA